MKERIIVSGHQHEFNLTSGMLTRLSDGDCVRLQDQDIERYQTNQLGFYRWLDENQTKLFSEGKPK